MLSHGGILKNCEGALEFLYFIKEQQNTFVTWLPLSHSYEHTVQFVQLSLGAKIFYSESLDKLLANLKIARPTIMTAVPRFYTNLVNKIKALFSKKSFHIFKNIHILESEKNLYIFNEGLCCFNLENILFNYLNKKIKFSLSETSLQFLAKEMIIAYIELRDFNTVRGIFSSSNILLSDVYVDINEDFYEQEPLKGGCNIKNFYKYKSKLLS